MTPDPVAAAIQAHATTEARRHEARVAQATAQEAEADARADAKGEAGEGPADRW